MSYAILTSSTWGMIELHITIVGNVTTVVIVIVMWMAEIVIWQNIHYEVNANGYVSMSCNARRIRRRGNCMNDS